MYLLALWFGIFLLGLALYFAPVFLVRRMYEGFAEDKELDTVQPFLREFDVTGTPTLPEGALTTSSTPAKATAAVPDSNVLAQGSAFQSTVPAKTVPDMSTATVPAVSLPSVMIIAKPVVKDKEASMCPPPKVCPDMSQYIRKDSIPCWGCKLG